MLRAMSHDKSVSCRVGKSARSESFRVSCELDRARHAHAVGCQWWARRAKRAFAPPCHCNPVNYRAGTLECTPKMRHKNKERGGRWQKENDEFSTGSSRFRQ